MKKLTETDFKEAAELLDVNIATIKAVAEVESSGGGFLSNGKPKILFEPHIFWKELRKAGFNPRKSPLCYPTWVTQKYGSTSSQPQRLDSAIKEAVSYLGERNFDKIRTAGLKSCSWGKFQIMGFNYKKAGHKNLQSFINAMYQDEGEHLFAFVNYVKNTYLDDELRELDWRGFARGYNGKYYWKNNYHTKLENAYKKYSK